MAAILVDGLADNMAAGYPTTDLPGESTYIAPVFDKTIDSCAVDLEIHGEKFVTHRDIAMSLVRPTDTLSVTL
jgi:hypothetical protein